MARKPIMRPTHRRKYALDMKIHELDGHKYLIFRESNNQFHVFNEIDTKEFAERAGIVGRTKKNAQKMMKELWEKLS